MRHVMRGDSLTRTKRKTKTDDAGLDDEDGEERSKMRGVLTFEDEERGREEEQ